MESATIMPPAGVPCILGVDPGISGGLAFLFHGHSQCDRVTVEDMPVVDGRVDGWNLASRIKQMHPTLAVIEDVGPMPTDSRSSAFKFGANSSAVYGVICGIGNIPLVFVTPSKWKRYFRLPGGPEGKEEARALALRRFPDACKSLARKKDHGRAEAALIALWAAETRAG